jgi:hypothetical protein
MFGAEVVVGYLIAWGVRKAKRVGARLDGEVDQALDAGLERLHALVADRLTTDPALAELERQAAATGQVDDLTRQRVSLSVQAASQHDAAWETRLGELVTKLSALGPAAGTVVAGQRAVMVTGDVRVLADNGSAAAVTMGDVRLGPAAADPPALAST